MSLGSWGEELFERRQIKQERGRHGEISQCRRGVRAARMASLTLVASIAIPESAWAKASGMLNSTRTAVGTLPLLAALGIGIAVAVGAVIAFLHMTAKGRNTGDYSDWADAGEAFFNEPAYDHDQVDDGEALESPQPQPDRQQQSHREDHTLTDYTIPLPRSPAAAMSSSNGVQVRGPKLCGLGGDFSGLMFRVTASGLTIGRDPGNCQIVFPAEAAEVSRRHCSLQYEVDSQVFILEDLGSSNGTFLSDGSRIEPGKRYPLRSGERFALSGDIHWFAVQN